MAAAVATRSGGSAGGFDRHSDVGKYVRYTAEQVEELERVYAECPKPSSSRRQQLIRDCPILSNIEPKQIKVWFQNRRCREKQRKESSRLLTQNRKLMAMNKLLTEENERLQKQVSQLVHENTCMRQQLNKISLGNATSCESAVTTPQNPVMDVNNPAGLLSIAEETLAEFLVKATGTAVDWVQMPGMKPGPDSIGIVSISNNCNGVAARACGLVNLEPAKIIEILKDRPSWLSDCREYEVFMAFPAGNGGTIELVYMQMYAPTTLAPARDFWTLRYTTALEDGSLVVCERSLSGSGGGPSGDAHHFVRAEMLPSGYLIRHCEGGGSIVHIVDHLNLEAWNVPEVLRPLYQSSRLVAQKMTIAALRHIRQIAMESSGEVLYPLGRQPSVLRIYSQRLQRGFNDAINGFNDNGWSNLSGDGVEDVVVASNSTKKIDRTNSIDALAVPGGVICAKASMLLQNVPPALLVRFLREHRSEWSDCHIDAYVAASMKSGIYSFPGLRSTKFSGSQVIMPLAHTVENEEFLEVVRLEGQALSSHEAVKSQDIHLLQLCSGIDDNACGACFQLVFAPIDEVFPDDAPFLPCGFRVILLDSKPDNSSSAQTLDLASNLGTSVTSDAEPDTLSGTLRSVLTIAFQFPYEDDFKESVVAMARQYVRSIISVVQRVSLVLSPSQFSSSTIHNHSYGTPDADILARWICQSYSYFVGAEMWKINTQKTESTLKMLWHHHDAILCCSLKAMPVLTFANQAGLDMLETTLVAMQDITLDKIFDEIGRKALCSEFTKLMQQGYVDLPAGTCFSAMGRHVAYEEAVAWKVLDDESGVYCLAFSFTNWSFV